MDLAKGQMCVERSDWKGQVTSTKGGRLRYVPLTARLAAALKAHRHLRGARVLCEGDGRPLSQKVMQCLVSPAALDAAIRLFESGSEFRGEIMEAAGKASL